ncbi:sigma-70 family RNA polymerase sigma factor [Pseudomonas putida]|uniref:sigma-70 family RNA polymerase sigma factor n=1 Tax=Pseudomonas putida TaxID=303 RepID=UPI0024E0F955|nr:sigma-70 family RNA polymerase sigma factor [Pseudomonas putida]HDS0963113.1 sigma-70 family RNA polymerase sigma factor [Pseudomonas putida]HDS0991574.1 sigma-70 family RNA polymerase sigma factor [Pseudomonas putida]
MSRCNPSVAVPSALTDLYDVHHSWLVCWLRSRLGCSHEAADLAQDTFVRLLLNEKTHPKKLQLHNPRPFLATVARRVLIDSLRRKALEQRYLDALAEQAQTLAMSEEDKLLIIELLQAVDCMLDGLGRKVKRAFLLSQLQGLGYKEIAADLGVSVSAVTKYVAKATEHCLLFALDNDL